jgi:L-alanine-DL-glutamate epimerase-like enolase superfamily enzyme
MNRRDWMRTWAGAAAMAVPSRGAPNAVKCEPFRLQLRHTWTTTMSSSAYRDVIYLQLTRGGITGYGEGAPIVRYHEAADAGVAAIGQLNGLLQSADFGQYDKILHELFAQRQGNWAAKSAIDIALMDWNGKKLGVPLYRLLGLDAADAPVTTFSIGIDTPEMTRKKVEEAASYPVLKIKVGLDQDEQTIESVRAVTNKPLRVDANEGFKSKEEALRKINWLATQGVEFIEQPLPADHIEEQRWLRGKAQMPIFADEACLHPEDIPRLAEAFDGIVVKLDKAGGTQKALEMIRLAKSLGKKVMIGCMVSSSVSVTAAAHLSPLCDYADLDGNLLIANDPFHGVKVVNGKLILPDGPGLGLQRI